MKKMLKIVVFFFLVLSYACKKNSNAPSHNPQGLAPVIHAIIPDSGIYATVDTITGANFIAGDTVRFNGAMAVIQSISADTIIAVVPKGAGTGPVTVSLDGVTGTGGTFNYEMTWSVTTVAGDGNTGYKDGQDTTAEFFWPGEIAFDNQGNLFISDVYNNLIRKMTPGGLVSTFCGNGAGGFEDGAAGVSEFFHPGGLSVDPQGNVYEAEGIYNMIRKITPDGTSSSLAGQGGMNNGGYIDGAFFNAKFNDPTSVAVDQQGVVYVADCDNNLIRKIDTGWVSTFAGNAIEGHIDGPALFTEFFFPTAIAIDSNENLYVADQWNFVIRKISNGVVTTIAGDGTNGHKDGPALQAEFSYANGIALDKQGNIYIADSYHDYIREITTAGNVITLAGNGNAGYVDGPGNIAEFSDPLGIAVDANGNVFVSDFNNNRIRKISLQ